MNITDFSKGQVRYYRSSARVEEAQPIEIVAVYTSKNRIKARYIGGRGDFMIDLTILAAHGGEVSE
jgi:hypothetical protein